MKSKFILLLAVLALPVLVAGYLLVQRTGGPEATPIPVTAPKYGPVDVAALKAKAEAGDPAAETSLGRLYLEGTAVKADVKEAVKWIQMAADTNYPDALATLGELTRAGQGVPRNLEAAAELYRRAAESGSVAGQYNLGYSYEQGAGVKQNEHEAARWYQLAAEGGDPLAQFDIGQRYALGVGVETNRVQAFKWLTLAAAQGQADSAKLLPDLQRGMSSDELAEAQKLVGQFTPRASK